MARRTAATVAEDIRVNPQYWFDAFHETKGLLACLVEILKNGFDWDAEVVRIITTVHSQLRHVDDGRGMDAANRRAFLSVGYSTAGGEQSGTFGTGAKKFIFTFASKVRVVTAPYDEPGFVYVAEFTPMELAEVYSNPESRKASEFWQRRRKSASIWPHAHKTGTDTTYTLRNPESSSVRRGRALAGRLSERLDMVLIENRMVRVDDEGLPPKQVEGQVYILELSPDSPLGQVKLVLYRPKHKSADEDLRMTDTSIGEVSFRDVFVKRLLTPGLRARVPGLFLENDVCGLIKAAFLHDHVTEQRDSYDAHIADDERVEELLRLLQSLELEIADRLGITLSRNEDPEAASRAGVEQFIDRLQSYYNPQRLMPPGYVPDSGGEETDATRRRRGGPRPTRPQPAQGPSLLLDREEFALGETIEARLVVPEGSSAAGFHFYLDQAHGNTLFNGGGVVRLIAAEVGRGMIRAVNPRTSAFAEARYEVVTERVFHLSARGPVGIQVGSHFDVSAVNTDKLLSGQITWQLEGPGELQVTHKGMAVRLSATRAGRAQIVAFDTQHPSMRAVCEVLVMSPENSGEKPFCIRSQYFVAEYRQTNLTGFNKPATIVRAGSGQVHRLIFNTMAPGFQEALSTGSLQILLAYATAVEFAKHFRTEEIVGNGQNRASVSRDWGEIDPSDIPSALLEVQNDAAEIFSEILGG